MDSPSLIHGLHGPWSTHGWEWGGQRSPWGKKHLFPYSMLTSRMPNGATEPKACKKIFPIELSTPLIIQEPPDLQCPPIFLSACFPYGHSKGSLLFTLFYCSTGFQVILFSWLLHSHASFTPRPNLFTSQMFTILKLWSFLSFFHEYEMGKL